MRLEPDTRHRILACAGPIFARNGFHGATVRDICDAANVNLASINYYFGDKQGLYTAVLTAARDVQQSKFPFTDFLTTGQPEDRLRDFISVLLQRLGIGLLPGSEWETQVLVRELMRPGDAGREIVEDVFRPYFELLLEIIDELSGRSLSRLSRLRLGFSVIGQCLFYRVAGPIINMLVDETSQAAVWNLEETVDQITQFALRGIPADPESNIARNTWHA